MNIANPRPCLVLLVAFTASKAVAQGIPEPDLVMYGTVLNVRSNANIPLGYGTLSWSLQPAAGGSPVSISTALTNLNKQISYILRILCETPVPGYSSSPNTIQLSSTGTTFDRSQVSWFTNALTFAQPSLSQTTISTADRGRIDRVDLQASLPIVLDPMNRLLPIDWEIWYFGANGVNPYADADGDRVNNLAEYLAGTDPTDPTSVFKITSIGQVPGAVRVQWSSAPSRSYALQLATNLGSGFLDLATNIQATPPLNSFLDTNNVQFAPAGSRFYRIRLQQ